jgi:putative DNA primase/helicase
MSAATISRALHGFRSGSNFLCRCPVPSHGKGNGDRHPSLSVGDGRDGGILVRCFSGCNALDVLHELARRGLLSDSPRATQRHEINPEPAPDPEPEPDDRALELWRKAQPIHGTLGEDYLQGRGISIDIPKSLRFIPYLDYMPRIGFPAMVAAVQRPDRKIIGIQITFLDPSGDGKAKVETPRKTFGRLGRGAVRLGHGSGPTLGISEGVETGLSASQMFGVPVWCCLGAMRMARVAIPDNVTALHVFGDNDAPGKKAAFSTKIANEKLRSVRTRIPVDFPDWNDALVANMLGIDR